MREIRPIAMVFFFGAEPFPATTPTAAVLHADAASKALRSVFQRVSADRAADRRAVQLVADKATIAAASKIEPARRTQSRYAGKPMLPKEDARS